MFTVNEHIAMQLDAIAHAIGPREPGAANKLNNISKLLVPPPVIDVNAVENAPSAHGFIPEWNRYKFTMLS